MNPKWKLQKVAFWVAVLLFRESEGWGAGFALQNRLKKEFSERE
jgi:hypothetical protein